MINDLQQAIAMYQEKINALIEKNVVFLGDKTPLRDACEYALRNGGKRFRPALVFLVSQALNSEVDVSKIALAVEYFHTASLIADDLPCMDDDQERRNKPATHIVFGEATALMATYALISAGYECLAKNAETLAFSHVHYAKEADLICRLSVENVSYNTGLFGATGGQYLDLNPPHLNAETLFELMQKKTASLFEISFVLGWLYGGGEINKLPLVKKAAGHFGLAFQMADDLEDMQQDQKNNCLVNSALVLGKEQAEELLHHEITNYLSLLHELGIASPELSALANQLHA